MKPTKLTDIQSTLPAIDLFISAVSFEDRCFTFIENVDHSKIKDIWFTYNENEREFYESNLHKAEQYSNAQFIKFSTDDPLITGVALLEKFQKLEKLSTLLIDISTFTHEGLLILFKFVLLFQEKFDKIFLTYVGAKAYSLNEEGEKKWLSKGTKTIRSILGYPGILNPSQKNHLIILFGFELERTAKLIEAFEFNRVSIGVGPQNDSISEDHYSINRKRHIDLLTQYEMAETFEFSLTDSFETAKQIKAQIEKYPDHNVVITPLNNKISTIGAALVAFENRKVQISYVRAHEYNYKAYSEPADDCYFYEVVF